MKLKNTLAAAVIALTLGPASSWATVIWSSTASGSGADGALSASATFAVSDGQIVVTLTNTLSAALFVSAGQALSDISFTLGSAPGSLVGSSAAGQFGDASGTPVTVTYVATDTFNGDATPLRWLGQGPPPNGGSGFFSIVGNTITMEAIGGGSPSQMIAPFVADGGAYPAGNNGLQQQNSYVIGPGTFTLDLDGVTENTTILSATFSFGTGPDTFLPGTTPIPENESPEPNSLALLGLAGLLVGFMVRRRQVS